MYLNVVEYLNITTSSLRKKSFSAEEVNHFCKEHMYFPGISTLSCQWPLTPFWREGESTSSMSFRGGLVAETVSSSPGMAHTTD